MSRRSKRSRISASSREAEKTEAVDSREGNCPLLFDVLENSPPLSVSLEVFFTLNGTKTPPQEREFLTQELAVLKKPRPCKSFEALSWPGKKSPREPSQETNTLPPRNGRVLRGGKLSPSQFLQGHQARMSYAASGKNTIRTASLPFPTEFLFPRIGMPV